MTRRSSVSERRAVGHRRKSSTYVESDRRKQRYPVALNQDVAEIGQSPPRAIEGERRVNATVSIRCSSRAPQSATASSPGEHSYFTAAIASDALRQVHGDYTWKM